VSKSVKPPVFRSFGVQVLGVFYMIVVLKEWF